MRDTWLPVAPSPVRVLEVVTETVADLDDVLWAARPAVELLDTIGQLERLRSVLDAVQLRVVAEVDASDAARTEGWASTKDFVTAVSGGRKGAGAATVALARAIGGDRAATGHTLGLGAISRTQAEVIVAAVDRLPARGELREVAERLLLDQARSHDATDLARTGRHVRERLDPDGAEAAEERALRAQERSAHLGRFLAISEDGIGGVRLRGRGTIEDAAWIRTALLPLAAPQPTRPGACRDRAVDPAADGAGDEAGDGAADGAADGAGDGAGGCGVADCAHDGRDSREHGTRMWDALVEATRRLAGTTLLPTSHGSPPRVTVTIDHHTLRSQLAGAQSSGSESTACAGGVLAGAVGGGVGGVLEDGVALSAATVRRMACDAEILPVALGTRSEVLDVGRSQRLVTPAIWLALTTRDRHCAFPGCTRAPIACDAHHIRHWADGGPTALTNLVLLCRRHHTHLHHTPWQVRLNPHDQHPEFLPPTRLDPDRQPIRTRPLRR